MDAEIKRNHFRYGPNFRVTAAVMNAFVTDGFVIVRDLFGEQEVNKIVSHFETNVDVEKNCHQRADGKELQTRRDCADSWFENLLGNIESTRFSSRQSHICSSINFTRLHMMSQRWFVKFSTMLSIICWAVFKSSGLHRLSNLAINTSHV
jgi:hypothetical protein